MDDLLDNAPCGFLAFSDDGTIVLVNATLATILRHERDSLQQLNIERILNVGSRIFYQTHFFPLLKLHDKVNEIYLTLRAADGTDVPVLLNAVRRQRDGQFINDCMIFTIEQRGKFEDELLKAKKTAEQAARARDDLLAVVSHELRTPLHAIVGWAQILRLEDGNSPTIEEGLEIIERNAHVQSRLIEDLLDVSRVVSGKLRLDVQTVDPVSIVQAALDVVKPAADAKSIRIETALESTGSHVSGDPDRLQQVMWNLLSNAVKFTPEGGSIRVNMQRRESSVEVLIADTGTGISADFLPYVFERFRQAQRDQTRRQGGLGLGLAITKEIVELHGGWISAHSDGEGRGTQFVVSLPTVSDSYDHR